MNITHSEQMMAGYFPELLSEIVARMAMRTARGKTASYIGPLAEVNPKKFGIAMVMLNNLQFTAGDADECFSIQSLSKVFTLALTLGKMGNTLWKRIGRETSASSFDSIAQLEHESGIPRNPFINSGAIVLDDFLLSGRQPKETIAEILRFIRFLADDDSIIIDSDVAFAEKENGFRNEALANYMKSCGNLENLPAHVLGVYYHHCAVSMSCRQLAWAGAFLASGGRSLHTGASIISARQAKQINSIMMTCGLYNGTGDYAFRVGLPSKSGVGGGILAIAPGMASIAVWSPGLNAQGNSKLGIEALEILSERGNLSIL